jgi:hypothetical protein
MDRKDSQVYSQGQGRNGQEAGAVLGGSCILLQHVENDVVGLAKQGVKQFGADNWRCGDCHGQKKSNRPTHFLLM